jgi:hypothetical protein
MQFAADPALAACRGAPAQLLPELAKPENAFVRQVAGDDRGVDRADRRAGDPVGPDAAILERRIGAGLVRAERAAARQHQRDPVETGQALVGSRARQTSLLRSTPCNPVGGTPQSGTTIIGGWFVRRLTDCSSDTWRSPSS